MPSRYLKNSQPSRDLPTPASPDTTTSRARDRSTVSWNSSLSARSSRSRPRNGASSPSKRWAPPLPATTCSAVNSADGLRPALEEVLAGRGVGDRPGDAARVASSTSTVPGSAIDWIRAAVLTTSPATIPCPTAASRTAASPVTMPARARSSPRRRLTEHLDRVDEVERGPDRPLGVVLLGDRRPPHRHHRVADELLGHAAVAVDDGAGLVEVRRLQLADGLGVALTREGREADQVDEQDRHQPPLRVGGHERGLRQGNAAAAAEPLAHRVRRPAVGADARERGPAVAAEAVLGRVGRPARPTLHRRPRRVVARDRRRPPGSRAAER
jgi:hypothetical protein